MKKLRFVALLLATIAFSIQAWSYRITDNYTIEVKFKINAIAAGIAFRAYEGFDGQICMWQFNVGTDGSQSKFRPHDWKVGGILLAEYNTTNYGVTLNTTDWFVTKIVVSKDGTHADTYLRRADDATDVLIDSRDGNFRFGMVGTRQDHDGSTNESASYDYFKVTANGSGDVLYYEDFEETNGDWRNDPIWDNTNGWLTTEGRNLNEVKYFPNNMLQDAVKMHYAVEADVTIESGFVSIVFGLDEANSGTNYMWQISPNYYDDNTVCNYYHLDNGSESWKAHAAGPRYPGFTASDFQSKRHVKIEVVGNVVYTYVDGTLVDTFTQCDLTDLALLNSGKIGFRADGGNSKHHKIYIDNVKVTAYDAEDSETEVMNETFDGGISTYFTLASHTSIVQKDDDYALLIDCDGTTDTSAKVRLIQSNTCTHFYQNGICCVCKALQEPGGTSPNYTIANAGQLIRFSEIVNGGNQSVGGTLLCDIDMENSTRFTPIGLYTDGDGSKAPYAGEFNGGGHVVKNMYVKIADYEVGMFSRIANGGRVHDLGIVDSYFESTNDIRAGAIAGEAHNVTLTNCFSVNNEIETTDSQKAGIAGEAASTTLSRCYTDNSTIANNYASLTDNTQAGVSAAKMRSGELCLELGSPYRQTLGTDAYPTTDSSKPNVYKLTVGSAGYASFVPEANIAAIPTGVTAYAGQKNGDWLHLEPVTELPADAALIVKAAEGNYYCNSTTEERSLGTTNDLTFSSTAFESDGTYYCLADKDAGVGFYQVKSGVTIPARKAYLSVPAGVKAFYGFDDDEATGIKALSNSPLKGESIYNLAGQRISKMQKGINIINGRKVLF